MTAWHCLYNYTSKAKNSKMELIPLFIYSFYLFKPYNIMSAERKKISPLNLIVWFLWFTLLRYWFISKFCIMNSVSSFILISISFETMQRTSASWFRTSSAIVLPFGVDHENSISFNTLCSFSRMLMADISLFMYFILIVAGYYIYLLFYKLLDKNSSTSYFWPIWLIHFFIFEAQE